MYFMIFMCMLHFYAKLRNKVHIKCSLTELPRSFPYRRRNYRSVIASGCPAA